MPFYGSFEHFRAAVESILAQDDPEWTLTIVDDVYPDLAPGEWAKAIDDPRVTYIRNETNLRPSRNYNKCIGLATQSHVVIMGCDDVMLPGYVGRVRSLIASYPDADIIQPGVSIIDENGAASTPLPDRVKGWYRPRGHGTRVVRGGELAASLLRSNWTYFPSLVWRTERLRSFEFRADLDVVQDLAMMFEITKAGGYLLLDDQVVFAYRRHSSSVSAVTGPDGSRFVQERTLFYEAAEASRARGWNKAARVSRRYLTSRLNAVTALPHAGGAENAAGRRILWRHILGLPF